MAKKRRKKSSKCPEPFNTLIDLAGGATMNAIANKMEEKHHYRKRGVPNPYRASAIGLSTGRLRNTEDIIRLGGFLGAMGSFDPDDTEADYHYSPSSSIGYHIDEPWKFDDMNVSVPTNNNKYAWRLNCEDGSTYGIYPKDYETRQAYNLALANAKKMKTSFNSDVDCAYETNETLDIETQEKYTFCKISRIDNGKNDYFFSGDLELKVGDFVVVPTEVGQSNAIVIHIESYVAEEVPKPVEETETILEKMF
ncbi:MAG: hypothetical protein Q4A54_00325 [Parabacteroides sp.]|nr:hypothetical protein [Parabacteroides sp.]